MPIAFFDIDRTIIPGTSMERIFFRYLLRKGYIDTRDVIDTLWHILLHMWDTSGIALRSKRPYLRNKSYPVIEALAEQCFNDAIAGRISAKAMERIRLHIDSGDQIVLISGTLEVLAKWLSKYIGAIDYIACDTEVVDGLCTGRIKPPIPYGKGKLEVLLQYASRYGLNLAECYAYGDSISDLWIFERVGHPRVVNPGGIRILMIAKKRGWDVLYW